VDGVGGQEFAHLSDDDNRTEGTDHLPH
jgi:hypothetical protein